MTNFLGKTVSKLRRSDGAVVATYAVGDGPAGVGFDGTNIWVASNGGNSVCCLRPSNGAVLATYPTGGGPFGVAFDEIGSVWVANFSSDSVSTSRAIKSAPSAR